VSARRTVLAAIVAASLVASTGAVASNGPVTVDLDRHGTLVQGGQAALVRVAVACQPGHGEVLEAFVLLDQGTTSGQGGISGIVCDGARRTFTVRVTAFDGPFRHGRARGDAFVLICDDHGQCVQGEDIEHVLLRRHR
jgi:hypothetical protein